MAHPDDLNSLTAFARPDGQRSQRTGMPEVILAASKTTAQCLALAADLLHREGRAILSRVPPATRAALHETYPALRATSSGTTVVISAADWQPVPPRGHVGILAAGTSDLPVAEEAALVCEELGCTVSVAVDVGVAGLHRLHAPLHAMLYGTPPVNVLIVAAGMDGALPSVVAGLVAVPVVGLPTAVGYGMGGGGEAALLSMLQSCAPGLAVVNIDNGVGAAAVAARIARQAVPPTQE